MHNKPLHPDTLVIHAGQRPEPVTGAVMPPIFTSSTYAQRSPGEHTGFEYSRSHNPTRYALERMVARLEGSTLTESQDVSFGGFAFASGLAAMDCILELLKAGDDVVCMDDVYGGTNRQFSKVKARSQGLVVKYADLSNPANLAKAMTAKTALVWVESPTNPTLKLVDLSAIAAAARKINPGVILVCDNTFCTPINQRPLAHGFDISHHSATKYLGGHSDVVAGLAITSNAELAQRLRFHQNAVGAVLGPFDSYLVLRGIKTLALRMARHNASGLKVAQWLERHEGVERVVYPGLAAHPQHALARRQMEGPEGGCTGMVTFFIKGGGGGLDEARRFMESLKLFALAESLGGVESLVDHPAIMTHASVPPAMRQELGIADNMIRLSVGIEDVNDLIADLDAGLKAASSAGQGHPARVKQAVK